MSLRSRVRGAAARLGVLPALATAYRTAREWTPVIPVRNVRLRRAAEADGLPLPPSRLVFQVTRSRDLQWFLSSGAATAEMIRTTLSTAGAPLESRRAVLDFGCGCGRVLRQWRHVLPGRVSGSDYNADAVAWARAHLPFARVERNLLAPPLAFADAAFDGAYAISVFTHLPAELQQPWLDELRRVIEPGGVLLFTLHGAHYLPSLSAAEQARFRAGELVVHDAAYPGTNFCNVYHPESFVRRMLAPSWDVLAFVPRGATGSPYQDVWVVRRRA